MSDTSTIEQRSPEWYAARLGKVTSSRLNDVMARIKSGYSATRRNYMAELACEILTGVPYPHFQSRAMQDGTEREASARAVYEATTGHIVTECGFFDHPMIEGCGGSPDGLVDEDGIVEIKCPYTATHIATLQSGISDITYYAQMQNNLACTERQWCDFVSYEPNLPAGLRLFVCRVPLDREFQSRVRPEIVKFITELNAMVEELRSLERSRA